MTRLKGILFCACIALIIFACPGTSLAHAAGDDTTFTYYPGSLNHFEHLTSDDGLSQNAGLVIYQDQQGFIWFGTQDGLNRYDGYNFKVYKNNPDDPESIGYNSVLSLQEDGQGRLWVGTWGGGISILDPASDNFTRYVPDPANPASLSSGIVSSLLWDSHGRMWVGTSGGLDLFNPSTGGFIHYRSDAKDPHSLSSDVISKLAEDPQGNLWVGTGAFGLEGNGLNRFDPAAQTFTRFTHNPDDPASLASDNISGIYPAADGTLWIATGGYSLEGSGLDHLDPASGKIVHYTNNPDISSSLASDNLISMIGDADSGLLWVGTWQDGLDVMQLSQPGVFHHFKNNPLVPESISPNTIWSLCLDRSGILWAGSANNGINKLSLASSRFRLYRNDPNNPSSLSGSTIGAFAEAPNGDIWVGTWGSGLDLFHPATGRFERFMHDPDNPNSLANNLVLGLLTDLQGTLWIGTMGSGLDRYDPSTGQFTHYPHDPNNPNSLINDNITPILQDRSGQLWLGTFDGLDRFNPKTGVFIHYRNDPAKADLLSYNQVVGLSLDTHNVLWIGTWGGGLNRLDLNDTDNFDPAKASFQIYRHDPNDPNSLSQDLVWPILNASEGTTWVGTEGGLNRFDPQTGGFQHFLEKDGLPNATVLGILEDDMANLWITTNNGLSKYDTLKGTFTNYYSSDGLQSNEFSSNAYMKAHNGTLYFGGINGMSVFNPLEIVSNPVPPPVVVTNFTVFNQPYPIDTTGTKPVDLSYKQNFISFEFAALDYHAPQKNQYEYTLEGFDRGWIQAGNRHYANYTNLPGGNYVFKVKAANSDGVWDETGISIPISVTPPIWQMLWFQLTCLAALAALLIGGIEWRINDVQNKRLELEQRVKERTLALNQEIEQRKRVRAGPGRKSGRRGRPGRTHASGPRPARRSHPDALFRQSDRRSPARHMGNEPVRGAQAAGRTAPVDPRRPG